MAPHFKAILYVYKKKCTTRNQSESTYIIITEQKRAGGLSNNRKSIDCLLMTRGRCPNFRITIKKSRAWENIWTKSQITFYMQSPINLQKKCILSSELSWQPGKSTHAGFKRYKWSVLRDGKFAFSVKSLLIIQADLSVSGKMMRFICYAMLFVKIEFCSRRVRYFKRESHFPSYVEEFEYNS